MRSWRNRNRAPASSSTPATTVGRRARTAADGDRGMTRLRSVTEKVAPSRAATRRASMVGAGRKLRRWRTRMANDVGIRPPTTSTRPVESRTRSPLRCMASRSSVTNSGFPAAPARWATSRSPGSAPRRASAMAWTSSPLRGPRTIRRASPSPSPLTRRSRAGRSGDGRRVTTKRRASRGARRASRAMRTRLEASAQCRSSSTRARGPSAQRSSTWASSASDTRKDSRPVSADSPLAVSSSRPSGAARRSIPSASTTTPNGRLPESSSAAPRRTRARVPPSASSNRRVLPMPASPETTTTRPSPRRAAVRSSARTDISGRRPTNTLPSPASIMTRGMLSVAPYPVNRHRMNPFVSGKGFQQRRRRCTGADTHRSKRRRARGSSGGRDLFTVLIEEPDRLHGTGPGRHRQSSRIDASGVAGDALAIAVQSERFGHEVRTAPIAEAAVAVDFDVHRDHGSGATRTEDDGKRPEASEVAVRRVLELARIVDPVGGQAPEHLLDRDQHLEAGEMGAKAGMGARSEGDVRVRPTIDQALLRPFEDLPVDVGRPVAHRHSGAGGNRSPVDLDRAGRIATEQLNRRHEPQALLAGGGDQRRIGDETGTVIGVLRQVPQRVPDPIHRRLLTGRHRQDAIPPDLEVGERPTPDRRLGQHREVVLAWGATPGGNGLVDIGDELCTRPVGPVPLPEPALEDVAHPSRQLGRVLLRNAEEHRSTRDTRGRANCWTKSAWPSSMKWSIRSFVIRRTSGSSLRTDVRENQGVTMSRYFVWSGGSISRGISGKSRLTLVGIDVTPGVPDENVRQSRRPLRTSV